MLPVLGAFNQMNAKAVLLSNHACFKLYGFLSNQGQTCSPHSQSTFTADKCPQTIRASLEHEHHMQLGGKPLPAGYIPEGLSKKLFKVK